MKDNKNKEVKKLLLVDDDPNLVLLVKDYLEYRGYQVITAGNGKEALDILNQELPDMVICDVMMPELDGYHFVKAVRENKAVSFIPIMLLSAKGQTKDRIEGLEYGADVYMNKPFEPEELVAQVKATLKSSERRPTDESGSLVGEHIIEMDRDVNLTSTESKVIRLVAQGMNNQKIAEQLKVSKRTIESHVSNMLTKTNLHNRTELARWAMENRLA